MFLLFFILVSSFLDISSSDEHISSFATSAHAIFRLTKYTGSRSAPFDEETCIFFICLEKRTWLQILMGMFRWPFSSEIEVSSYSDVPSGLLLSCITHSSEYLEENSVTCYQIPLLNHGDIVHMW